MKKFVNFFEHLYVATRYGDWSFGCENYKGKPKLSMSLMPYDGWNFAIHILPLYLCVSYPWCGDLS